MDQNITVKQEFDDSESCSNSSPTSEHDNILAYSSDVTGGSLVVKNEPIDIKESPKHNPYEESYSIDIGHGQQQKADAEAAGNVEFERAIQQILVTPKFEMDELVDHGAFDGSVTGEGISIKSETYDIQESSELDYSKTAHSTGNRQQESAGYPRESSVVTSGNQFVNPAQPFSWDKQTTQLLVERYIHLKDAFKDPKIKKKKLWDEIKQTFISKGHNVTEEMLDRKWRNMKKTYTGIKDNIRRTGKGRILWEYYHHFDDIYGKDKIINLPQTLSSISVTQETARIDSNLIEKPDGTKEELQPSTTAPPQIEKQKDNKTLMPKSTKKKYKSGMFYLRKKLVEIETAHVSEIKVLREALERNNEIQERRNEILQNLCDALKKP